jgi:hypothetical protein
MKHAHENELIKIYSFGAPRGGGLQGCSHPPPPKTKFKKTDFAETVISKVLCDLRFSLNQPPKLKTG